MFRRLVVCNTRAEQKLADRLFSRGFGIRQELPRLHPQGLSELSQDVRRKGGLLPHHFGKVGLADLGALGELVPAHAFAVERRLEIGGDHAPHQVFIHKRIVGNNPSVLALGKEVRNRLHRKRYRARLIRNMTHDEARTRLATMNRSKVAREAGLDVMWISRFYRGKIRYPRENFDTLTRYLQAQERRA